MDLVEAFLRWVVAYAIHVVKVAAFLITVYILAGILAGRPSAAPPTAHHTAPTYEEPYPMEAYGNHGMEP